METSIKLYLLNYKQLNTYLVASLFVIGNLVLPQIFHLIPEGGKIWLPIYFFTLIGAYKYGWKVGLLTAILSPTLNALLFGMPTMAILPMILLKSVVLAFVAGFTAHYFKHVSIPLLAGVVLSYQLIGSLGEWLISGSLWMATQDIRLAIPGMLVQVLGGYLFIKYLIYK